MTNMHNEPFDDLRSGDLNGNMPDEMLGDELLSDAELADAERFAEVLDLLEAGGGVDLDPREDPTLAALTTVAAQLHDNAREATSTPRFASYRARSRDYLLHRIAREREALAASTRPEPQREKHAGLGGIPFLRWNVLSPIASAAAAAVAVLAFVAFTASDTPAPVQPVQAAVVDTPAVAPVADDADEQDAVEPVTPQPDPVAATVPSVGPDDADVLDQFAAATSVRYSVIADDARAALAAAMDAAASANAADETPAAEAAPPPTTVAAPARTVPVVAPRGEPIAASTQRATPRTVRGQLLYIETLLGELTLQVERQQPVPAQLLRELTESIAAVAYGIESNPDGVTHAQVLAYIHAAADGRFLLATAVAEEADEAALNAARRVAQDGVVVAGWYFKYH